MGQFPSMKAKRLLATLERKPLGYRVARQAGSHRRLEAPDRPPLTFAFHDNATISAGLVRKIEALTGGPVARPAVRPSTPPPSIPVRHLASSIPPERASSGH